MKISSGQKLIITSSMALLLILAASVAFGWLTLNTRITRQALQEARTKLATYSSERQAAGEIKAILDTKRPLVEQIKKTIINHDRPIEFLDQIINLGKTTSNTVVLDYVEQESDTENLAFRITAEGKRNNIFDYLKLVELMPYALLIEDVRWEEVKTEKIDTRLSIYIRVRATSSP